MAHFRCLIRGEGFRGILEGRDGATGFYVNRPVEAVDAVQARRAALDQFKLELAERGWSNKGGRFVVDEIVGIEASEIPSVGQGFVVFRENEAEVDTGPAGPASSVLLINVGAFSVHSHPLSEPWMLTTTAMNSFRKAICFDATGTVNTIVDLVPVRAISWRDRLMPLRQFPVRLTLQPGPDLSIEDVRARLLSILRGDSEIADVLRMPIDDAIARVQAAHSPSEIIEAARAIVRDPQTAATHTPPQILPSLPQHNSASPS